MLLLEESMLREASVQSSALLDRHIYLLLAC
jgi:hypothetical protein